MRAELATYLAANLRATAHLKVFEQKGDHVLEGALCEDNALWHPIVRGVPCFLQGGLRPDLRVFAKRHGLTVPDAPPAGSEEEQAAQREQARTNVTFSDKTRRFKRYGLEASHQAFLREWYRKKLGLASEDEVKGFYRDKQLILEVGPGSGFNTRFIAEHTTGTVIAADVSDAAFTTFENTQHLPSCHVVQADVMKLPFPDASFDFAMADGVLHHTPNTRAAVEALYRKVKPGGQMFFYLYKQMGAARCFCDQHIREHFTRLPPDECYAACEAITELGRELSRLNAKITLTKPIPILGIPAGVHDVQRLLYYNFLKCFWNDAFDYETNNMVNFDWYHPHNAWQHSEAEVAGWLRELGVFDYRFHPANPNGISVLLRKPLQAQRLAA
jgi:2-polyprenyl-3-methyl-5-hydroxy-6-metoxy-1,4-benzoquinol methylase